MGEGLPAWLDDEEPRAPGRGTSPRPWLLALAVVPWLVVIGLVVTGGLPGDTPPATGAEPDRPHAESEATLAEASSTHDVPAAREPVPGGAADPGASTGPPVDPTTTDSDSNPPRTPGDTEDHAGSAPASTPESHVIGVRGSDASSTAARRPLEAVALLIARAWLTDVGPDLAVEGVEPVADRYLEHAMVEDVVVAGEHAVVTLIAVVLERDEDVYERARARRLAVPVALGAPPRPAGSPWWLADADLHAAEPETEPEEDPDVLLALGEALAATGAAAGEVLEAGRTPDGWWLVTAAPTAAAEGDLPLRVWLPPSDERPSTPEAESPDDPDAGE